MKQGIQTLLSEAGEAACYALDIIEIAERVTGKTIEPVGALQEGIGRGFIYYNGLVEAARQHEAASGSIAVFDSTIGELGGIVRELKQIIAETDERNRPP